MAKETKQAKEFLIDAAQNPYTGTENTDFIRCTVDLGWANKSVTGTDGKIYDGQKAEIFWPIPKTDEEAKGYFGPDCDLAELVKAGVRQLSTRPNYKASCEGMEWEQAVANAQDLAKNYNIGRKTAEPSGVKAKAKKIDEAKALGIDIDALIAQALAQRNG